MKKRVVITGIGVIAANGIGKNAFWNALKEGKSGIKKVTSFDVSDYPCQAAGEVSDFRPLDYLDKIEVKRMVRISQFAVAAARMALADAGYGTHLPSHVRSCITLGGATGTAIDQFEKEYKVFLKEGVNSVSPFGVAMASPSAGVSEIANSLGVTTVQKNFSNDCTSGVDALGYTVELIKKGEITMGICGGNECPITPLLLALFSRSGLLPTWTGKPEEGRPEELSRPFDRKRSGGVLAEGAAVFVVEETEEALSRGAHVYGEIIGYGSISSRKNGIAETMEKAIFNGLVSPSEIDYICAHAPSDPRIDAEETKAIKKLFGERAYRIPVSSIKSMIGSSMSAAGVLQVAAVLLAFQQGIISPTINYKYPDPECDLDYVPNVARHNEINMALVNAQGLGGGQLLSFIKKDGLRQMLMPLFYITAFLTIASCLGLGFFVFLRKKNSKNFIYILFNLNLAAWATCILMIIRAWQNVSAITIWIRIATATAILIPAVFHNFAVSIDREIKKYQKTVFLYYFLSFAFAFIAFSPIFIKKAFFLSPIGSQPFGTPEVVYGKPFIFLAFYAVWVLVHSIRYLWQKKNDSFGVRRLEFEYILLSILAGTIFVIPTVFLSPFYGKSYLSPLGVFSGAIISGVIAYGIARHKIMEVSFILKRTTVYVILTVFLALIYGGVVFVLNLLFLGKVISVNLFLPNMVAAMVIAFIFSAVREKTQNLLDRIFFRRRQQPEKILSELSEILSSREDISRLLRLSLERIAPALKVKNVLVALRGNKEADNFFIGAMVGHGFKKNQFILELNKESVFIKELARGDILIRDEMERMSSTSGRDQAVALLKTLSAEMSVPLLLKNELVGFLIMSQKENGKVFSKHDLEFLHTISGQLAMVINNAELFSQLQRAERLAAAGIIAAGMAHEIRNPLVSIKTFVQLLPEKFNDPEFRQTFTQIASQEVDRINRLLEDLLNFARPAPVQKKKTNLSEIIEKSLFMLTNELTARKITVKKEYLEDDIFVEGDEVQLQRVFSNLFLNSIQAMENGGRLTIAASASRYKQRVFIKIVDTGKGVSSKNLSRIFDPFFSTRTGGTGLGLAIAHNIVKEHGGEIEVQSAPNNGTTFTLEFPGAYLFALEEK